MSPSLLELIQVFGLFQTLNQLSPPGDFIRKPAFSVISGRVF